MNPGLLKWLPVIILSGICLQTLAQNSIKNDDSVTMNANTGVKKGETVNMNDVITKKDEMNIKSRAERVVKRFMNTLNVIATGMYLEVPETEKIIRQSFLLPETKIFYDSAVIIEDDLRHLEANMAPKEKPVLGYLKDFDIFYKKNEAESVIFSNFNISNIKKRELFIY